MDKVYERCCGIDVHKKVVVACLKTGRKKEVCEYGMILKISSIIHPL